MQNLPASWTSPAPTSSTCRKKVAAAIDVSPEKLDKMITPIEKVYAVVDHTRCLAYMLGDCIVPSNVREGYLARLVIRRTLRMMNELKIEEPLADLIEAADPDHRHRTSSSRTWR